MSRNKCKICGYRFKSDDEIICPECFTARDEDISCGSFSGDLHSHDLRADNEQDGWFGQSENDTFKEEKNDFIAEERKDEAKDENFQSTYTPPTNNTPPSYSSTNDYSSTNGYSNSRAAKLDALRNYAGQSQSSRYNNAFATPTFNRPTNTGKKSGGCAKAVVIVIIIMAILPTVFGFIFSSIASNSDDDYSYDEDYNYDQDYYDNNYDSSDLFTPKYSDDGSYSVTYTGMTIQKTQVSKLTDEQRNSITGGTINGDDILEVTVSLDTSIDDNDKQVKFSCAFAYSYESGSYDSFSSRSFEPEDDGDYSDDTTYEIKFYVPVTTEHTSLYVYLLDSDQYTSSFIYDLPINYGSTDSADLSDISGADTVA